MKPIFTVIPAILLSLSACTTAPPAAASKHYHLTGKVISLNAKDQTAAIDAQAIPNFMDAMTMDYPIKSKSDFEALRVGAGIQATVDVSDDGVYGLSQITVSK